MISVICIEPSLSVIFTSPTTNKNYRANFRSALNTSNMQYKIHLFLLALEWARTSPAHEWRCARRLYSECTGIPSFFSGIFPVPFNEYAAPSVVSAQLWVSQMSSECWGVIVLSHYFPKLKAGKKVFSILIDSIIYAMYILQGYTMIWDKNLFFCCLVPVPLCYK